MQNADSRCHVAVKLLAFSRNYRLSSVFVEENEEEVMNSMPIAMVVDDEPLIRMDVADMVSDEGYDVIEAGSADEALALIDEYEALQLVVTDIQMPGRADGLELARQVCERRPEVCVIVASGAVTPSASELPEGARFIGKPVTHAVVRQTIGEIFHPTE